MVFVPVNQVAMSELVYLYQGQITENTLYWNYSLGWSIENQTNLAVMLLDYWNEAFKPLQPSDLSLIKIKVTDLTTQNSPGIEYTATLPIAGTGAGNPLPNSVTMAVKFSTGFRGRSFRGRNYVCGLFTSSVLGNQVVPTALSAWQSAYAGLMAVQGEGFNPIWGVVSRFTNKAPRTAGIFTEITGVSIDPNVDSQRRRLAGRGA